MIILNVHWILEIVLIKKPKLYLNLVKENLKVDMFPKYYLYPLELVKPIQAMLLHFLR